MVLSAINVFGDLCVRVALGCGGFILTCHNPASPLQVTSRITSPCLCNIMLVAVNDAVQSSPQSCPIDISAPYWSWGKMWAVLALVDCNGLTLSSTL